MKKTDDLVKKYKRDDRLSFFHYFIYEFGMVFLIVFLNAYGLIAIYNKMLSKNISIPMFSVFIILFILFGCSVSSILVYFTRGRVYSQNILMVCEAAQRVAEGDFSIRLAELPGKTLKTELDILKEDFNKMVSELASIERLRDDFVADVSHEIKTPLSVIQSYAELLQTPGIDDDTKKEYMVRMSEAIHNLSNLVSNILNLNKIENQDIIQKEKFFLDEQIRCAILSFEEKLESKNIEIIAKLDEVVIKSNKTTLELVWNNLLSNAIKFTDDGGKIVVELKENDDEILFLIKDNGCGMSEETQKHIFEKFYQGDSSHSAEGNGLGLALVKRIVDMLDAQIKVESELDNGTEIQIVLHK